MGQPACSSLTSACTSSKRPVECTPVVSPLADGATKRLRGPSRYEEPCMSSCEGRSVSRDEGCFSSGRNVSSYEGYDLFGRNASSYEEQCSPRHESREAHSRVRGIPRATSSTDAWPVPDSHSSDDCGSDWHLLITGQVIDVGKDGESVSAPSGRCTPPSSARCSRCGPHCSSHSRSQQQQ